MEALVPEEAVAMAIVEEVLELVAKGVAAAVWVVAIWNSMGALVPVVAVG